MNKRLVLTDKGKWVLKMGDVEKHAFDLGTLGDDPALRQAITLAVNLCLKEGLIKLVDIK